MQARIADCWQAIYWATTPDVAMQRWLELRELLSLQSEAEDQQFLRDTGGYGMRKPPAINLSNR